jgi:renalase
MAEQASDVLIIGAGLSGLMAARILSDYGLNVTLMDKGRSIGGRLATRPVGEGLADTGAQFFTVRSDEFRREVDKWLAEKIVYVWSKGFSDGIRKTDQFDGYPRYATRGGMNALAQYLAKQLDTKVTFHNDVSVTHINRMSDGWQVEGVKGDQYTAKAVLMTPPVPLSLALIGEQLVPQDREALEGIRYLPCLAGLFRVEGDVNLPEPGALQRPEADLRWIADNQRKGISSEARVITVHASGSVSQRLWNLADDEALQYIQQAFESYLAEGARIIEAKLERWPYSQPTVLHPERYLMAEGLPLLVFAGDAFGEARVEGAFLSGSAAGEALSRRLMS